VLIGLGNGIRSPQRLTASKALGDPNNDMSCHASKLRQNSDERASSDSRQPPRCINQDEHDDYRDHHRDYYVSVSVRPFEDSHRSLPESLGKSLAREIAPVAGEWRVQMEGTVQNRQKPASDDSCEPKRQSPWALEPSPCLVDDGEQAHVRHTDQFPLSSATSGRPSEVSALLTGSAGAIGRRNNNTQEMRQSARGPSGPRHGYSR
jgi:hypothetical protein